MIGYIFWYMMLGFGTLLMWCCIRNVLGTGAIEDRFGLHTTAALVFWLWIFPIWYVLPTCVVIGFERK